MGRVFRFVVAVAVVVLAMVGTRPAAGALREQTGLTTSPELACYIDALAQVFGEPPTCG